jgi:hypothetical protein
MFKSPKELHTDHVKRRFTWNNWGHRLIIRPHEILIIREEIDQFFFRGFYRRSPVWTESWRRAKKYRSLNALYTDLFVLSFSKTMRIGYPKPRQCPIVIDVWGSYGGGWGRTDILTVEPKGEDHGTEDKSNHGN